jgi:glutamine synthetase
MDMTACFLPKPLTGINGSGMHVNLSLSKAGKNLYWDADGPDHISKSGWDAIDRLLTSAPDICLILNPSVNAYRRLDPHFEAPNQIKASANNRGAMVRIPAGNAKSARLEVRSIAPDVNPYMVFYTILKVALEGPTSAGQDESKRSRTRFLPDNIYDAIRLFKSSRFVNEFMDEQVALKFAELKQAQADRCPKALGSTIKVPEIQFHHEVTNQYLWGLF